MKEQYNLGDRQIISSSVVRLKGKRSPVCRTVDACQIHDVADRLFQRRAKKEGKRHYVIDLLRQLRDRVKIFFVPQEILLEISILEYTVGNFFSRNLEVIGDALLLNCANLSISGQVYQPYLQEKAAGEPVTRGYFDDSSNRHNQRIA